MEAPVAGIDVSKDKLIMYFQGKYYEFPNDRQGFEEIRKILPKGCKVGIESTGVYHVNLAKYLMGELGLLIPLFSRSLRILGVRRVIRMMLAELVVNMGDKLK